jgi:hypothetical protein
MQTWLKKNAMRTRLPTTFIADEVADAVSDEDKDTTFTDATPNPLPAPQNSQDDDLASVLISETKTFHPSTK